MSMVCDYCGEDMSSDPQIIHAGRTGCIKVKCNKCREKARREFEERIKRNPLPTEFLTRSQ